MKRKLRRRHTDLQTHCGGLGAGFFVFLSVLLAHYHTPHWLLLAGFVGLNLLQTAFSKWCPMMVLLRKLGVES